MAVTATDIHRTIDAVWRIEAPRLIAGLTRIVRDIALADLNHTQFVPFKVYDVTIVGNLNHEVQRERSRWLARIAQLSDRYNVRILGGIYGEEYTRVLNQSKITFNRSIRGEMNIDGRRFSKRALTIFSPRQHRRRN